MINMLIVGFGLLIVFVMVAIYSSVVVVEDGQGKNLYVMGNYKTELDNGVNFVPPFVSDIKSVDTKVKEVSVPNVTEISGDEMRVNAKMSVYCQVEDTKKFSSNVDDYEEKIWKVAKSEILTIIAESKARSIRRNQRKVEDEIRKGIHSTVSDWGVRVDRVDLIDVSVTERD